VNTRWYGRQMQRWWVLVILLAACGGDDVGGAADALPADAAAIDGAVSPLVGQWSYAGDPALPIVSYTFDSDGTFVVVDDGGSEAGTYTLAGPGRLSMTSGGETVVTDYVVTSNQLLLGALIPQGSISGLVGVWSSTAIAQSGTSTTTVTLNSDMTGTLAVTTSSTQSIDGTWVAETGGLALTLTGLGVQHYKSIGATGIGLLYFTKS
jgi:hypothetical protein